MSSSLALLVSQSVSAQAAGGSDLLSMGLFLVPMLVVMYVLMIRPERKRQTEHAGMLRGLKRGDEVALSSGIIGKIHAIEERAVILEIADKTRVKVLKVAISGPAERFLTGTAAPTALPDAKDDDKKDADKKSA